MRAERYFPPEISSLTLLLTSSTSLESVSFTLKVIAEEETENDEADCGSSWLVEGKVKNTPSTCFNNFSIRFHMGVKKTRRLDVPPLERVSHRQTLGRDLRE